MTITEPSTADVRLAQRAQLATLVGETVAALLPADEAWSIRTDLPGHGLPDGDIAIVGAQLGGHAVFVVTTTAMGRRIEAGPPPAEGILDGLTPAVAAVAEVLGLDPDVEVELIDAGLAADAVRGASLRCALLDGHEHLVTIAVVEPEDDGEGPAAATFEPIVGGGHGGQSGLEVLHDVVMGVTVELGRTRMPLRDILSVVPGSVIELDRAASAPVDVLVNGTLIARGEVVVIDEEFGIRITEVVGREQTIHGDPTP